MDKKQLTRKEFMLGIAGGGIALVVGCGDDTSETGSPTSTGSGSGASSTTGDPGSSSTTAGTGASSAGGAGGTGPGSGGSGQGGSGGSAAMCAAMITAAISNNHMHELIVPLADIDAGADKTYDCTGKATHCHQVTLTAADFMTLKNGGVVTKKACSITDHEFVLSCAPGAPAPGDPDCDATPNEGKCP